MSYEAVRGHEPVIRILREAVRSGRVASAYLFFGPEGVGKALVAKAFASALLCRRSAETGEACGDCPSCTRTAAESHPGFVREELEKTRTRIRLEQVHRVGEQLSLRPLEGERKVAILDDMEVANLESFNALLKIVEEPPPGTTLVLISSMWDAVPETIRSRCQGIRFGPLPVESVERILEGQDGIPAEDVPGLARLAEGSPGRALRLARLGYPALAEKTLEVVARAEEAGADPVLVAKEVTSLLTSGKGRLENAERVREALRLLADRVRREELGGEDPSGGVARAELVLEVLVEGLRDLHLNLAPDSVLRSCLVRILPGGESGESISAKGGSR